MNSLYMAGAQYFASHKDDGDASRFSNARTLFQIRVDYLYNILRTIAFGVTCWRFSDYEPEIRVPPELATQLVEFVKDIRCQCYFRLFIKKQPDCEDRADELEQLLLGAVSVQNQINSVPKAPRKLEAVFAKYLRTKSFKQLMTELVIAHEVSALGRGSL